MSSGTPASAVQPSGVFSHPDLLELAPAAEPHRFYNVSKRTLDFGAGAVLLGLAIPIIIAAAAAVAATTRSNPLFIQQRIGLCGRPFSLLKVKTMHDGADESVPHELDETQGPTFKSRDDPRVTRIGQFLRKASIDELPQLWNVVIGQMSLVGPRPPLPREVVHYTRPQLERLTVKPGITCIWQVCGRSSVPFRSWMAMDRVYVRKRSLRLDLLILARTPWAVLSMRGAY